MRKLRNTLYNFDPDIYLTLNGELVVAKKENKEVGSKHLHLLENIVTEGYTGVSPALMGKCMENNISITFLKPNGKFMARVTGQTHGNVLLRREQYRIADNENQAIEIAKLFIMGKIYNAHYVIERAIRDHYLIVDVEKLKEMSNKLKNKYKYIQHIEKMDQLRGYEGEAAKCYFSVFNELILNQKEDFIFNGRNKRPPLDEVNALLSYFYTLLKNRCVSALETVGLDPYVGFMHTDRPGRESLALDLMEELRHVVVDRFVLTLINKKVINKKDFIYKENGEVLIDEDVKRKLMMSWEKKNGEIIKHPFIEEKIEWGLVPFVQAQLLAHYIRGSLDAYPPFLWK